MLLKSKKQFKTYKLMDLTQMNINKYKNFKKLKKI